MPKEIGLLNQFTPSSIAAGDSHSACVTADGQLYTWGDGQYGKLGHGSTQPELKPQKVVALQTIVVSVSCGAFHTLALDKDGKTFCFGQQKGVKLSGTDTELTDIPRTIQDLPDMKLVVAGVWNSYGVSPDGAVFSWGSKDKGMLGRAQDDKTPYAPKPLDWLHLAQPSSDQAKLVIQPVSSTRVAKTVVRVIMQGWVVFVQ